MKKQIVFPLEENTEFLLLIAIVPDTHIAPRVIEWHFG